MHMLLFPQMFYQERLRNTSFFKFLELNDIPGFMHLVTCRSSSVATSDDNGLNEGEAPENNLLKSLGVEYDQLIFLHQTHSNRVVFFPENLSADSQNLATQSADGVITTARGQFPVIQTADCLPILIVSPEERRLCMVHAGWRGTRDRIIINGLKQFLKSTRVDSQELIVALGPAIRQCCYEVGPEIRDQYEDQGHESTCLFTGNHFDLVQANINQIREFGISQIIDAGICTACRTDLFYSYRKEGETGRMWTVAGFFP